MDLAGVEYVVILLGKGVFLAGKYGPEDTRLGDISPRPLHRLGAFCRALHDNHFRFSYEFAGMLVYNRVNA